MKMRSSSVELFALDAFLTAVGVVAPVVLVLVLGNLFARFRSFDDEAKGIGSLVYWICLPALIWRDVSRGDPVASFDPTLAFTVAGVLLFTGILGYRYARMLKAPTRQV